MPEDTPKSRLQRIADLLARHQVEFLVIGGQAESLYGSPRITYDVDLCYRRNEVNLQHLAEALRELKLTLRGAPPDLPFQVDARSLALGSNFTFETPIGPLDLLGWVEPLGDYEALVTNAESVRLGDLDLRVISLEDLIRVKQHINRPKDRDSLMQLLAIQRVRQEPPDAGR